MKHHHQPLDRRSFLMGSGALAASMSAPSLALAGAGGDPGGTLVLLQLSGGNDGLSMIVPHGDDNYHSARKKTRHRAEGVLRLDDYRGLHPKLTKLQGLWDKGAMAIVEGVGHEDSVRSHFKALEVWHTARRTGRSSGEGWLGRLAAAEWSAKAVPERVVHLGKKAPYSVYSAANPTVALESPSSYRWFGDAEEVGGYMEAGQLTGEASGASRHAGRNAALGKIREVLEDAQISSARIRAAALRYRTSIEYPRTSLGASLRDAASIIHGGLGTRVISVELGGFDTHADQRRSHDKLMEILGDALGAFHEDLGRSGVGRKTTVLVFSEFGRRVQENGSQGTDHGKAGPSLVLGHNVNGGLYGQHPSMSELTKGGDLGFTTDFRSLYATVLERSLGLEQEAVLGARYPLLGFLS
ncbi:MAG: hypothetical protein ACI8QC_003574 [Planctomycetota bacterium]|jgi:uncharacterized protein (DUF1501 family)